MSGPSLSLAEGGAHMRVSSPLGDSILITSAVCQHQHPARPQLLRQWSEHTTCGQHRAELLTAEIRLPLAPSHPHTQVLRLTSIIVAVGPASTRVKSTTLMPASGRSSPPGATAENGLAYIEERRRPARDVVARSERNPASMMEWR